jgi:hypothetical protein
VFQGGASAQDSGDVRVLQEQLRNQGQVIRQLEERLRLLERQLPQAYDDAKLQGLRGRGDTPASGAAQTGTRGPPTGGPVVAAEAASSTSTPTAGSSGAPAPQAAPVGQQAPATPVRETEVYDDIKLLARQPSIFDRRLSFEMGVNYSRFDRRQLALSGFYALDAIFLGTLSVDQIKGNTTTVDLTARYGLSDRFGVDLQVPYVYRDNLFLSGGTSNNPAQITEATVQSQGVGDVTAGVSWQIGRESRGWADIVASARVRFPTGDHPFGIKTVVINDANGEPTSLKVPTRLPTGTGLYAYQIGLSVLKTYDPVVLYANVGYTFNAQGSFSDISNGAGVPGDVKLGNTMSLGAGMVLAMNDTTAFSVGYSMLASGATKTRVEGADWQQVNGSQGNAAVLSVGVTHSLTQKLSMITSVGVGLTSDSPNYTLSVRFPYRF